MDELVPLFSPGEKVLCYHGPHIYDAKVTHPTPPGRKTRGAALPFAIEPPSSCGKPRHVCHGTVLPAP